MIARIQNIETGESYLVESIGECRDYMACLAYDEFIKLGSIRIGKIIVESVVLEGEDRG